MKILVLKETAAGERRVALTPANASQLIKIGHTIQVESGAGAGSGYADDEYENAGAGIASDRAGALGDAELILQVDGPGTGSEVGGQLSPGQFSLAQQDPLGNPEGARQAAEAGYSMLALETIPRISRAQSMDVLSSMATLAGYKAVLLAADHLPKMFPMLMTAAGTVAAARVFVIGAGVAGLQAIATARRLGAIVEGYDVRDAALEQIESLGAKAVRLDMGGDDAEGAGGYAKEQGEDFNRRQQEELAKVVSRSDVVITTAAIPGRPSPLLITQAAVEGMQAGSVIVDLAAERGGNCEVTQANQTVEHHGVTVLGPTDLPSRVPRHASQMFGNNVTTLLKHLTGEDGAMSLDLDDEITNDILVAHEGVVRHPRIRSELGLEPLDAQPEEAEPETADDGGAEEGAAEESNGDDGSN